MSLTSLNFATTFAQCVRLFEYIFSFSQRKVTLSEQKSHLETNIGILLKELTTSESEQNNAIESEDYELAETFNATIADVQNRQSRNASELRTVASEVENLRSEQLELFQNHLNNIGTYKSDAGAI